MLRLLSARKSSKDQRLLDDVPKDHGLLVTLDDQGARMEFVPDQHLPEIHPHGHGPAAMQNFKTLSGGGSGVRVFGGEDPTLGSLVMKHGSERDTKELFALATISRELEERQAMNESSKAAAQDMLRRTPDFRMMHIAPHHLEAKPKDCWASFSTRFENQSVLTRELDCSTRSLMSMPPASNDDRSERSFRSCSSHISDKSSTQSSVVRLCKTVKGSRVCTNRQSSSVNILLGSETNVDTSKCALHHGAPSEGHVCLKSFVDELATLQRKRRWKFALAQKATGGPCPKTAAFHLANGNLEGKLLERLTEECIVVICNLQSLAKPCEKDAVETVRNECRKAQKDRCTLPCEVSTETDAFAGFSFKKNWHPEKGHFFLLRRTGKAFRSGDLTCI